MLKTIKLPGNSNAKSKSHPQTKEQKKLGIELWTDFYVFVAEHKDKINKTQQ